MGFNGVIVVLLLLFIVPIKALAEFFNVPASSVILISGQFSKQKVFEIPLGLEDLEKIPDPSGQIKLL
ncbi:hypothetical protein A3I48_02815 [Candidatus Daviesbacteria bacterium RIFCSPLOWO2_02_FULL_36_7]|uniref:Uncharacterized protein n=1 Tax=Candidatus Daviesbacteria bacterium RIFCSPLOWO2_02_FULL_36_7 TaxID=1797792 RepID=A0A1F5MI90_9BACT|nr:MAG: hypothetical protein A3I48_02815 [Candidatus Daviesbacteria bacterium RIFCSPLOWO2_02_FULL_36_7]